MADIRTILRHRAFWPFYARTSERPLEGDILDYFDLSSDDDGSYEYLKIAVPCGSGHLLSFSISPEWFDIELGLQAQNFQPLAQMGWWDEARWHPFAIRWEELLRLHQYWQTCSTLTIHPSSAFLLATVFVGHGSNEKEFFAERMNVIREHYHQLNLYSESECEKLANKMFTLPSEDDYNWTLDTKLGWVFGGKYPCYSLRNPEHTGGEEGNFPFSQWQEVVERLPKIPQTG